MSDYVIKLNTGSVNRNSIMFETNDQILKFESSGPRGIAGKTTTVYHGSTSTTDRPADVDEPVIWVGSVEPIHAYDNDIWITTA